MTGISLEVMSDRNRPEGGHAVILLRGLLKQPASADYLIEPVDAAIDVGADTGWPRGPLRPLETRLTADGVELIAGPDVVENPNLLPGTPVMVQVPSVGARAELLWPDVAPLARPRRTSVIAVAPLPVASPPPAAATTNAAPDGKSDGVSEPILLRDPLPAASGEVHTRAELTAATAARAAALAVAAASAGRATATNGTKVTTATANGHANGTHRVGSASSKTAPEATSARIGGPGDRESLSRLARSGGAAGGISAGPGGLRRIRGLRQNDGLGGSASPRGAKTAAEPPAPLLPSGSLQAYPEAAAPSVPVVDRGSRRLAALAIVAAVVAALSSILGNFVRTGDTGGRAPAVVSPLPTGPASVALYEVFAAGITSPRGANARDVTFAQSLERADQLLHGPAQSRDAAEGQYWLQRALVILLDDDRARWALSQLGTLYAEPASGIPDYARARALWQVAGGLGDPVAMCFLGNLHEFGLGGAVDKAAALGWYMRAKAAGGCRQNDAAIERVRK